MSPIAPLKHALAAVLATTHDALTTLGAPPDSALTWVLGIASLVVLVRLVLLPFVIHGVARPTPAPAPAPTCEASRSATRAAGTPKACVPRWRSAARCPRSTG